MTYTQYMVEKVGRPGTYQVCWLDKDLKIGSKVTFRGDDTWYRVREKYGSKDSSELELNRNVIWYSISKSQ